MTTLTLTILAKDILETNYINADDCAVTRALGRTEFSDYKHCGIDIVRKDDSTVILVTKKNERFRELNRIIGNLYKFKEKQQFDKIVDTEVTLTFESELVN